MKIERFLKLNDGGEISYTDYSGDGLPIILIHGFPLDQRIWKLQIEAIQKKGRRVVSYDMRGFGKSSDPVQEYSHEDDLKRLLDELKITECHIVGMSFGGQIALSFALQNPKIIKKLTLIGSGIEGYEDIEQAPYEKWSKMAQDGKLDEVRNELLVYGELGRMSVAKDGQIEAYREISKIIQEYRGYMFGNDLRICLYPEIINWLSKISCPTNIIVGENDTLDSIEKSKILAERIPNAKITIVKGVGHFVNIEKPKLTNKIIIS